MPQGLSQADQRLETRCSRRRGTLTPATLGAWHKKNEHVHVKLRLHLPVVQKTRVIMPPPHEALIAAEVRMALRRETLDKHGGDEAEK